MPSQSHERNGKLAALLSYRKMRKTPYVLRTSSAFFVIDLSIAQNYRISASVAVTCK